MKYVRFGTVLLFLSLSFSVAAQKNPFKNLAESEGKIGIGTKTPDELLTVKGTIHTQEVKVDLKGAVAPDYVFEKYFEGESLLNPDYEMLSIQELEQFLAKNKHLPNVPSAEEMKDNGMFLKEMNLLLLQKIEELTLYLIQQQKEIEELKAQIVQE